MRNKFTQPLRAGAGFIIVFVTAPSKKEGKHIVTALMRKRLIACGNILNKIDSTFIWNAKVDKAKEVLIILKTKRALFKKIAREIERLHSYEVPEIIAMPIIEGSARYLKWIDESVCKNF